MTTDTAHSFTTAAAQIRLGTGQNLWAMHAAGREIAVQAPRFRLAGHDVQTTWREAPACRPILVLANGCSEQRWCGPITEVNGVELTLVLRLTPDLSVVRFRYEVRADRPVLLEKLNGEEAITLATFDLRGCHSVAELRLAEFNEQVHSYLPVERPLRDGDWDHQLDFSGPIMLAEDATHALLFAFEHGSMHPDRFLAFSAQDGRQLALRTVKGSHMHGQDLATEPYCSVWCQIAVVAGDRAALASMWRRFVLHRFALSSASRQPKIFYNTWNYQERRKHWLKQPYLSDMNRERMLAEIDVAYRMGIEVFVIDTGWYAKTGDWEPSATRFPDLLRDIKARLDSYGMELGLWFAPQTCALSSKMWADHRDCVVRRNGEEPHPWAVWETEDSMTCCLVSRYGLDFADELIRIHHELGVTYFKWDAVDQYGCTEPGHGHGDASASHHERRDRHAYEQPLAMARIVERVQAAVPQAICDFDVTESARCVGLAFLSVSKYFLINNGPYFHNYDNPHGADGNSNLFFFPGAARTWICRRSLDFDRWIPSVLFLVHYLPDDGEERQFTGIASLVLGNNGIWGDLCGISAEGVQRFGDLLCRYKQVRDAITLADPIREGLIGGDGECHEKLHDGRGAIVIFNTHAGTVRYVSQAPITGQLWSTPNAKVSRDAHGRAVITATFTGASAAIIFVG